MGKMYVRGVLGVRHGGDARGDCVEGGDLVRAEDEEPRAEGCLEGGRRLINDDEGGYGGDCTLELGPRAILLMPQFDDDVCRALVEFAARAIGNPMFVHC